MTTESAQEAQGTIRAGAPTGFRRLTQGLLAADRTANAFDGLPDGVKLQGQLLAAFKAAAPSLGLGLRLVHAIDWLFRFTQPQDWGRGGRPIVWPSASLQQEAFGLSPTRVKALNRALIEAGLITMRDSPNGKRYGRRDPKTKLITEAYGFDLSPLAARHAEFVRLAEEAKAHRAEMARLRRRATIARRGIAQILETAADYGLPSDEWVSLARESRNLTSSLKAIERLEEMALGVESLERRQHEAREKLEMRLAELMPASPEAVNSDPKGTENGPHYYTYKPDLHPEQDTVVASEKCKSEVARSGFKYPPPEQPHERYGADREHRAGQGAEAAVLTDSGTKMQITSKELTFLAPRLRGYLRTSEPNWREIVDAADYLRGELGVSKSLWGEACLAMGRESAAIAIAIVSAKPAEHFRSTPGGYFHGMVTKAKSGELNLARTIWGLRQATSRPRRGQSFGSRGAG
ncbi:MAG: replication protein C [Rhodospirillales bacterium]|nr:replication protein C [Rhodospirillales bacterium]